jgi:phenylacetate-CoA ligase
MPAPDFKVLQLRKFNHLLNEVWERNPFYTHKWCQAGVHLHQLGSLDELVEFPFTTRTELVADQDSRPPLGTNLTGPLAACRRFHNSSGTTRAPVFWADTLQSWGWIMHCSVALFLIAGVKPGDRIVFALPFAASSGPAIMYEGACRLGCACFAAGHLGPDELLKVLRPLSPTVLIARPAELVRLSEAAERAGIRSNHLGVGKIICPGASAGNNRAQLEQTWGTQCFDRYGLTEAGSVAGECLALGGMHVLEGDFIAEVIRPGSESPVTDGEAGELVLTSLGRIARPIVRYRTGDLVRLQQDHHCPCGRTEALLLGGVRRLQGGFNSSNARTASPWTVEAKPKNGQ